MTLPHPTQQLRREKLAHFDKECTRLTAGLFVGGDTVARSREALSAAGVTHVLNATGFASPEYFRAAGPAPGAPAADGGPSLCYKTLWLQDTPGEDLGCVLYDTFDWLESVRAGGGVALVHCSQGVSRSVALCTAYLMWRDAAGYDDTFARVKAARGVANPNMGFACQLLQWAKRRGAPPDAARLYRIAPHSTADPRYLVPRQVSRPSAAALDARGAFVVHTRDALFVWRGAACGEAMTATAAAVAAQLIKYEGAPGPPVFTAAGAEPRELLDMLGVPPDARGADGAGLLGADALRCTAYDDDFAMYAAGRRSDAALRGGAGAQEHAQAASIVGCGTPLLPHRPDSAPRGMPRMSTPVFAPSSSSSSSGGGGGGSGACGWGAGDASLLRRSPAVAPPRLSSPSVGTGFVDSAEHFPPPPALEEREPPALYEFPSLERLHLFDSDDLQPGHAFLLLSGEGSVHVWLGAQHTQQLAPGDEPQAAAARVAAAAAAGGVPVPAGACVQVELEGAESAAFWSAFDISAT